MGSTFRTQSGRAFFDSIPWCAELLASPDFAPLTLPHRRMKHPDGLEETFIAKTLKTHETIRAVYALSTTPDPSHEIPLRELRILFWLGPGVTGHPGLCHGGFSAAVLDEAMGAWMTANREWNEHHGRPGVPKIGMTLTLLTTYKKPVPAPGVILVAVRFEKVVDGRKWYLSSTLEDGAGNVLVSAEGCFVNPRALM